MDGLTMLVVAHGLGLAQDLNLAFRKHPSVTVLGPAFDAHAARDPMLSGAIDVVVFDLEREDARGIDLLEEIRAIAPIPVVASTHGADPRVAGLVLAAGGSGLLPRKTDAHRAFEILRLASDGGIALPDDCLSSVMEHLRTRQHARQRAGLGSLTPRELEVLIHLGEGRSVAEIAASLGISGSTVQAHVKGIFSKLGVHSQVEAVRVAWRAGVARIPASA